MKIPQNIHFRTILISMFCSSVTKFFYLCPLPIWAYTVSVFNSIYPLIALTVYDGITCTFHTVILCSVCKSYVVWNKIIKQKKPLSFRSGKRDSISLSQIRIGTEAGRLGFTLQNPLPHREWIWRWLCYSRTDIFFSFSKPSVRDLEQKFYNNFLWSSRYKAITT